MEKLTLDKALTRQIIISVSPFYVEHFRLVQTKSGWIKIPEKMEQIFQRFRLDNYVMVYDDERRLYSAFALFLLGKQGVKDFNAEFNAMSPDKQMEFMKELVTESMDEQNWEWMDDLFPDTPQEEAAALERFNALSPEEKEEASKRALWFWSFYFGWFHQYIALMLHGQKLTTLVALAKEGDEEAFCKAIHIEPRLLKSHEYFRERYEEARENREDDFLKRIGYRIAAPLSPGRIRYPGLYVVFAMLEVTGWLDGGFTHEELLDICDEAGLDRWQNRIEDTNFLSKRLREYRRIRKLSSLSRLSL